MFPQVHISMFSESNHLLWSQWCALGSSLLLDPPWIPANPVSIEVSPGGIKNSTLDIWPWKSTPGIFPLSNWALQISGCTFLNMPRGWDAFYQTFQNSLSQLGKNMVCKLPCGDLSYKSSRFRFNPAPKKSCNPESAKEPSDWTYNYSNYWTIISFILNHSTT